MQAINVRENCASEKSPEHMFKKDAKVKGWYILFTL